MTDRLKITFFFLLVFCGVALRLICNDIPNFAPVAALALFAGFLFKNWLVAAMVPISVMTITNWQLGGYDSWVVMLSVYACLVLPTFLGRRFLQKSDHSVAAVMPVLGFSFMSSVMFFFVTNYAAWLYWYPRSWAGFMECYVAAIPFFRYTLMGDFFFCFMFFGIHAVAVRFVEQPKLAPVLSPELSS